MMQEKDVQVFWGMSCYLDQKFISKTVVASCYLKPQHAYAS